MSFETVFGLLVAKTVKSNQIRLNEFFCTALEIPTNSAFTQAKAKFKHTAFIELRQDTVESYYEEKNYKTYKGLILLANDGSRVSLPNSEEIKKEFGVQKFKIGGEHNGELAMGLASVVYDVLNEMVIDAKLVGIKNDERKLAAGHLDKCYLENICLIYDRGYPSYELCNELINKNKLFVMRCGLSCFKEVQEVWKKEGEIDEIVELKGGLKLRVIKFKLKTGTEELLITNIFDSKFEMADFKEIYRLRWKEEDFFKVLKERLNLENFSSLTVEGVHQDFESTMFIANIESIYTEEVDRELEEKCKKKGNKNQQKVNKNISFNAIKNRVFELFLSNKPIEETTEELKSLFRRTPTSIRPEERSSPRNKSASKSARYRKCSYKACF